MVNRTIESLPENTNPSDNNWIINTDPNAGNAFQKSRLLDVVKARYNPASGWVLRDGTTSPYQATAGDKLLINSNSGFIVELPSNPSFGDEIVFLNIGLKFAINTNSVLIAGEEVKLSLAQKFEAVSLIYINSSLGWIENRKNIFTKSSPYGNKILAFNAENAYQGGNLATDGQAVDRVMEPILGYDATNSNTNQPIYHSNRINGYPTLEFTKDKLTSNNIPEINNSSNLAVFVVAKLLTGSDNYGAIVGYSTSNSNNYKGFNIQIFGTNLEQTRFHGLGSDNKVVGSLFDYTDFKAFAFWWDGLNIHLCDETGLLNSVDSTPNNISTSVPLTLGSLAYLNLYINFELATIEIFNQVSDLSQITNTVNQLKSRYGI